MPSETIWSSSSGSSSPHASSYRNVIELVDADVAKMFGDTPTEKRRFSFNESGEIESNLFDFKASLVTSSYAASTGGLHAPFAVSAKKQPFQFGTASIAGGIASRHPPQDSFLAKFSSVADATRDIEMANSLGTLSLENSGRRESTNGDLSLKAFNVSPHGSLNENLNMPATRNSRHQSISDKIDNYNNTSPILASATLNQGAEVKPDMGSRPQNFWNPAAAPSFQPQSFNYFLEGSAPPPPPPNATLPTAMYGRPGVGFPTMSPPPFIMAPPQFVDPSMYGMLNYGPQPPLAPVPVPEKQGDGTENEQFDPNGSPDSGSKLSPKATNVLGVGLMNRQVPPGPGFVFHPFNPYPVYQQGIAPNSPPNAGPSSGSSTPQPYREQRSGNASGAPPLNSGNSHSKKAKARNNGSGKPGHHIYRSPLLEEVRSNSKHKEYTLTDIYGHVVEFTKDQHGSRFIQQKLPSASSEEKEFVFNELRDISYELMTDVFGNYVIQKFFEHGSTTQKDVLLECMKTKIYELSLQMYGCRVVQRALEYVLLKNQILVVEELRSHVLVCAKDQNGNHVIQKAIEKVPFENVRFILNSLKSHIYHLSTHPYGCRVIQRLLEYSTPADQREIMAELNRFVFYLIQDQYGNYVIQHILERGDPKDKEEILQVALESVVNFSKHKFASNVIEKCIKFGSLNQRKQMLHEVMLGNEDLEIETVDDDSPLALMMKDQFANYVIQKLVEGFDARSEEKRSLVTKLRQYLKQLSLKNNYGKHLASVEKMIVVAETALVEADRST